MKRKLFVIISAIVICCTNVTPVKAFDDFYSDSEVQFYDPNACDPSGGNAPADTSPPFSSSSGDAVEFSAGMSIDGDGSVPGTSGDTHIPDTSLHAKDGALNANDINFIALGGGWSASKGIKLGDVVLVEYKDKKAFAVYGDNWGTESSIHGEGSVHLAKALGIPSSPIGGGVESGVKYTVYKDSNKDLDVLNTNKNQLQAKIDQVGTQASGTDTSSNEPQSCCAENSPSSDTDLPDSIPKYWRDLINNAASKHENADPRLVAATLWAENRGWPDPHKNWSTSGAGAQGPWQFIPSSWASMGQDGDNDGVKDPNNPKDAVHAAYVHLAQSKGKPLVKGFTGTATSYYDQAKFNRDGNNLLSFAASYNGLGAPNNTLIKNFPLGDQNSDYVRMVYWLIGSNFSKTWSTTENKVMKVSSTSAGGIADDSTTSCGSNGGDGGTVVEVAKQQYEKNKGIAEYGGDIKKYTQGAEEAWCADFVSWVYKAAGKSFTGGTGGWRYPSVVTLKAYFNEKHEFFKPGEKDPQPGDVAFYIGAETPDGGSAEHVNIVIEVNGGTMTTIGGNESDQLMKSQREIKLGSQSLAGFGRFKN